MEIRILGPGDEAVVEQLATPALLEEPHTIFLVALEDVGKALLQELARMARERVVPQGFVLTDADNIAAMRLYASVGGERNDVVEWDFDYAAG
jgi:hypothetical protein